MRIKFHLLLICAVYVSKLTAQTGEVDHWESVVFPGDSWRYFPATTSGPVTGWQDPLFDDTAWLQAVGGFGYGDNDDMTDIGGNPNPLSVAVRTRFVISDTALIELAVLHIDFDDGFVAWINGVEVARSNLGMPGDFPAWDTPAADHEAVMYNGSNPPNFIISAALLKSCLVNGENILAIQVNNANSTSSDMTCIPYLSVGLTVAGSYYRAVPYWFTEPYMGFTSSQLPLVIIETNGQTIFADYKIMADLKVVDNGKGEVNRLTDEPNGYSGKIGIEYRGSSSMMFPKKNLGFETRTIDGADSAVTLLGMPTESDWTLHGPYSDKSLMRNYLAYHLARAMGNYAPRAKFCEMFLNSQYQGIYVLIEKIKRDSNRVAISRLDTADVIGDDLTGGYIIKIDRSADGSYTDGWFSPYDGTGSDNSGPFFSWHYPKWEDILPVQMNYIRNRITRFEDALYGTDYRDPYVGYRNYIDVPSFVDYFLLVEISKNTDGYRLSTFLHKDRDDRNRLIRMGPIWDYNLGFGNADYLEAFNTYGWNYSVSADGWGTPFWWGRLLSDPFFANQLHCRWLSLRSSFLTDEYMVNLIDAVTDTLGAAVDRNFIQWPVHGSYIWPNPYVGNNYAEDINYMKDWVIDRIHWMDEHMPGTCVVGIEDPASLSSFVVLAKPNPSKGQINLEIQQSVPGMVNVYVTDLSGRIVFHQAIDCESRTEKHIPLPPGIYIVGVSNGSAVRNLKVIVR